MKDQERNCTDRAAQSRENYMKDLKKSRADNDIAAGSREIYKKALDKSHKNETGLAISCNSKKTAAVIGIRTGGLGGLQPPPTMY